MTRKLRPPLPIRVRCDTHGRPTEVTYGGHTRTVTQVAEHWLTPAAWWAHLPNTPTERVHYKLVTDGRHLCDIMYTGGAWYLDRIFD